jgi:hypothetical protein
MNGKMIVPIVVAVGLVITTAIILKMANDSIAEGRCTRVGNKFISASFNC